MFAILTCFGVSTSKFRASQAPTAFGVNQGHAYVLVAGIGGELRQSNKYPNYECAAWLTDNGMRVARALSEIGQIEGLPEIIINDNGPEFISKWGKVTSSLSVNSISLMK
jgi:hypothetical protein